MVAAVKFRNFHCTVWKNEKFGLTGLTEKIFRQINSLVICLVKPLLSRNFCRKNVRLKFHNFHTMHTALWVKIVIVWSLLHTAHFRALLQKYRENEMSSNCFDEFFLTLKVQVYDFAFVVYYKTTYI